MYGSWVQLLAVLWYIITNFLSKVVLWHFLSMLHLLKVLCFRVQVYEYIVWQVKRYKQYVTWVKICLYSVHVHRMLQIVCKLHYSWSSKQCIHRECRIGVHGIWPLLCYTCNFKPQYMLNIIGYIPDTWQVLIEMLHLICLLIS